MIGNIVLEVTGKRTARRVLSVQPAPTVEVSFEESGTILGHPMNNMGTYWSGFRPDGSLYGEGQGVVITSEGEMATWKGQGVGKLGPGGAVSYRGSLYFNTSSAKLASLNTMAVAFEYEVDAAGNTKTKGWEWK